jgi:hypothetical protein
VTEVKTTINVRKQGGDNCLGQAEYVNLKKEDGWMRRMDEEGDVYGPFA